MNSKMASPKPGDLVLVYATDDGLIPVGSYGIIIGEIRAKQGQDQTVSVVFNFTCPWLLKAGEDVEVINASGGPQRGIRAALLKATKKLRNQQFLCTEGPGSAQIRKVHVWKIDLTGAKFWR